MTVRKKAWIFGGAAILGAAALGVVAYVDRHRVISDPGEVYPAIARIERLEGAAKRLAAMRSLSARLDPSSRFYTLDRLCALTLEAGELDAAERCARDLLAEATKWQGDWNYGNALHRANILLGQAALKRDDLEGASRFLLESTKTPGSPQLATQGPDAALASALLARGRTEAVAKYVEGCRSFWRDGGRALDVWSRFVQASAGASSPGPRFFEDEPVQGHLQEVLPQFWGNARLGSGEPVLPADERDRATLPVDPAYAEAVARVGVSFGVALHCGVAWQEDFLAFMKAEVKARSFTPKQRAFVAFLHGFAQSRTAQAARLLPCTEEDRKALSVLLGSHAKGLWTPGAVGPAPAPNPVHP
ncbi:MAG: hypothetical protein QM765_35765 [Myxococcales bacterium]